MTHDEKMLVGSILEEQDGLTLADLCRACSVHAEYIIELVEEGLLVPNGRTSADWRFGGNHLRQVTVAFRLQRDLGVNLAGAALALQLMDEIKALRARLELQKTS